jgi:exodeoxyribonuclease V beta subunit
MDLSRAPLNGTTLIEASAGTGKTYTLTGLFLRLILEKRLPVDQILVVTFTEAATEDLRKRIRQRLTEALHVLEKSTAPDADKPFETHLWTMHRHTDAADLLRGTVRNFDLAQIFTIHGFCQRMLGRNGFECQALFDTTLEPDLSDLVRQACVDFWRSRILPLTGLAGSFIRNALSPEDLQNLAGLPFLAQDVRLEPDGPAPDTRPLEAAFFATREQLCTLWPLVREEVCGLLLGHTMLKGNMGKPEQLEKRLAALEGYVRLPGLELPDEFTNLTPAYMEQMTKKGGQPPQHRLFHLIGDLLGASDAMIEALGAVAVCLRRDFLAGLDQDMERRKRQRNVQGFDDLLRNMRRAVDNDQLVQVARNQYQAALVDEFQDTDGLQYAIFSRLFGRDHSLFLIGDPKQAIYSFRGADLQTYLRAGTECERTTTLATNYRSTPELIQAVNGIFGAWGNTFLNPGISYQTVEAGNKPVDRLTENGLPVPALSIWHARSTDGLKSLGRGATLPRICAAVTAEISRLLRGAAEGQVRIGDACLAPGNIAILVETHRQGEMMHSALRACNIHSVLSHTSSIFESPEALEILTLLRAVAEYQRTTLLRSALTTRIIGLDARQLRLLDEDGTRQDQWLENMALWHGVWQRQGLMAAMNRLITDTGARERLLRLPGGERRMTNVLHCLEILHARERETRASMRSLTGWFARQLTGNRREEFQLRLDSDRDAVRIVTIHKSKGLEYPVVFCPFLFREAKINPALALAHEDGLVLDLGSENLAGRQDKARSQAQAELIRLTYVALTRAASRCYLVWGRFNKSETSGPAWLFHGHRADGQGNLSWKTLTDADVRTDLDQLASPDLEVSDLPDLPREAAPELTRAQPRLEPKAWTRTLGPGFGLASFSGLTRGLAHAAPPGLDDADEAGDQPEGMSMARFPRGATAGSCLHRIFELLEFDRPQTHASAVVQGLAQYGLDPGWAPVLETMVERVLRADLGGFCLAESSERLVELEFLFPLRPVTREILAGVYRDAAHVLPSELPSRMDSLRFEPRQGFMTGFMDLVVRHQGRYHLLDWKSNWLGPSPVAYTPEALRLSMAGNHYFLQYHLYCLALDRYLRLRLPEYDYAEHFGGVHYVYLRGVDPKKPGQGIHFDRPDMIFLTKLGKALIAEVAP